MTKIISSAQAHRLALLFAGQPARLTASDEYTEPTTKALIKLGLISFDCDGTHPNGRPCKFYRINDEGKISLSHFLHYIVFGKRPAA